MHHKGTRKQTRARPQAICTSLCTSVGLGPMPSRCTSASTRRTLFRSWARQPPAQVPHRDAGPRPAGPAGPAAAGDRRRREGASGAAGRQRQRVAGLIMAGCSVAASSSSGWRISAVAETSYTAPGPDRLSFGANPAGAKVAPAEPQALCRQAQVWLRASGKGADASR